MTRRENWNERFGGWALITGASAGLGDVMARALAARGMDVILVARRADRLDALAADLRSAHGVQTLVVPLDLTAPDLLERLRAAIGDRPVGMLVNNAGFGLATAFHQQPIEKVAAMVDLNCRVPAVLARAFVEPMIARRRGALITLSSVAGFETIPYFSLYSATKAFDLILGEGVGVELEPFGITSLVIAPGVTRTEFAEVAGTRHYGSIATPEEVVEGALAVLGRRRTYVHGAKNRMLVAMMRRLLPRRLAPVIIGRRMRRSMIASALADLQKAERGG